MMEPIANQLNRNPKNLKTQSSTILAPTDAAPDHARVFDVPTGFL